jgi:hypothetical protein
VTEIPFDFTVGWEGEKADVRVVVLGGIFVREAADNAFSWSARSERRGDRTASVEERVTLALPEDGVISTTVKRLCIWIEKNLKLSRGQVFT